MSAANPERTPQAIVEEALGRAMTRELWTANYEKVLPVSIQNFELSGVLPAVFYMFRFAHRRGKGNFVSTFAASDPSAPRRTPVVTVEQVAKRLAAQEDFRGFTGETEQAILGDLLLAFCFENAHRSLGRNRQIQRVLPTHYLASWVDLPVNSVNLRYVPETLVAMLADHDGEWVEASPEGARTWFAVGRGFEDNVLLQAFHRGTVRVGPLADRKADRFQEEEPVGIDELLIIRIAQALGAAPDKARGGEAERISNQRPIAEKAARHFSEDMRRFLRGYAPVLPRQTLVELLESCIAVGLTSVLTSVVEVLLAWAENGEVPSKTQQRPSPLFVDASNGIDRNLRALAEECVEDFLRRLERVPAILMALRILDRGVRYDPALKRSLPIARTPRSG